MKKYILIALLLLFSISSFAQDEEIAIEAIIAQGYESYLEGDFETSVKVYLKALELNPTSALANNQIALSYFKLGDYDNAIPELIKVSESSISEKINLYLGNCYINTAGREQEAIDLFESISDTSKYYEHATWYRALAHLKQGNTKISNEILDKIIQYDGIYKQQAIKLSKELIE